MRDLVREMIPADIDFATTATPQQMHEMFTKVGLGILLTHDRIIHRKAFVFCTKPGRSMAQSRVASTTKRTLK